MNSAIRSAFRWWLGFQASAALVLGRKAVARALYEQIVELNPGDAAALASLGSQRMEAGDTRGAIAALVDLVEHHPTHADGWFNLGYVHEKCDDLVAAERCMREAVRLNPQHDRAWYGLALVLIRNGQLVDAVAALQTNITLQPMSPYGYYQLGMTYHHLGRVKEARRIVERLRAFEPKYAATLEHDIARTPAQAMPATSDAAVQASDAADRSPAMPGMA